MIDIFAENQDLNIHGFGKFTIRYLRLSQRPKWMPAPDGVKDDGSIEQYPSLRFVPSRALKVAVGTGISRPRDTRIGVPRSPYSMKNYGTRGKMNDGEDADDGDD